MGENSKEKGVEEYGTQEGAGSGIPNRAGARFSKAPVSYILKSKSIERWRSF